MVKVKVFSTLREICGKEFEIDAKDVKEMLKKAGEKYGKEFKRQSRGASILVNGKNISYLGGLRTSLAPSDEAVILPPAAGGYGMKVDQRKIQQMMKQMKIEMEEIKAEQVIIKTSDGEIVFEHPTVMATSMPGMGKMYQISGAAKEVKKVREDDVALVKEQTGVTEEQAREALKSSGGDLATAIMKLKGESGKNV